MSHSRTKPAHHDRQARHAAVDLLLPRLKRGRLTPEEAALLAAHVLEDRRLAEKTRRSLNRLNRRLAEQREAADAAIQEAEERARVAEARVAALEAGHAGQPAHALLFDTPAPIALADGEECPSVVLHTVAAPAAGQAAGVRYTASVGALEVGPGRGVDELRRRAIAEALGADADMPWPALIGRVADAHHWALRARSSAGDAAHVRAELTRSENARDDLRRRLRDATANLRQRAAAAARDAGEQQSAEGAGRLLAEYQGAVARVAKELVKAREHRPAGWHQCAGCGADHIANALRALDDQEETVRPACAKHPNAPVIGGRCGGCRIYPVEWQTGPTPPGEFIGRPPGWGKADAGRALTPAENGQPTG